MAGPESSAVGIARRELSRYGTPKSRHPRRSLLLCWDSGDPLRSRSRDEVGLSNSVFLEATLSTSVWRPIS